MTHLSRTRHPPENKSWQSNSAAYRPNYQQYDPYQQQAQYPGYYPNWGYDPNADGYGYNYNQYYPQTAAQPQVPSE